MSFRFDAAMKSILRRFAPDYVGFLGLSAVGRPSVLDVDLSAVSAATDVVVGLGDPLVAIACIDFQAGRDDFIDDRVLMDQALLRHAYHVPVHSVVIVLRPDAYRPTMTGRVRYAVDPTRGKMDFEYHVVKLWEIPVRTFLDGPVGLAPLAVLARLPGRGSVERRLEPIIREIDMKVRGELPPAEAADVMVASGLLSGLVLTRPAVEAIFRRVMQMEESTFYQMIVERGLAQGLEQGREQGREEGREEGREQGRVEGRSAATQALILRLGKKHLGRPTKAVQTALTGMADLPCLERIADRLDEATSWADLLATP